MESVHPTQLDLFSRIQKDTGFKRKAILRLLEQEMVSSPNSELAVGQELTDSSKNTE
jgi:hypothetical protein